eukprot:2766351-Alexandrium_andersonii.AAC.1
MGLLIQAAGNDAPVNAPAPHCSARERAVQLEVELGPSQASGTRGIGQRRPTVAGDDHMASFYGKLLCEAQGQRQRSGLRVRGPGAGVHRVGG